MKGIYNYHTIVPSFGLINKRVLGGSGEGWAPENSHDTLNSGNCQGATELYWCHCQILLLLLRLRDSHELGGIMCAYISLVGVTSKGDSKTTEFGCCGQIILNIKLLTSYNYNITYTL